MRKQRDFASTYEVVFGVAFNLTKISSSINLIESKWGCSCCHTPTITSPAWQARQDYLVCEMHLLVPCVRQKSFMPTSFSVHLLYITTLYFTSLRFTGLHFISLINCTSTHFTAGYFTSLNCTTLHCTFYVLPALGTVNCTATTRTKITLRHRGIMREHHFSLTYQDIHTIRWCTIHYYTSSSPPSSLSSSSYPATPNNSIWHKYSDFFPLLTLPHLNTFHWFICSCSSPFLLPFTHTPRLSSLSHYFLTLLAWSYPSLLIKS